MVISLALIAAFSLAATSSANLQVAQRVENTQVASELAESAVQRAIAKIMDNRAWVGDIDLTGPIPGSTAKLTFTPGSTPYCTNNADNSRPSGWAQSRCLPGGVVPGGRAHLVAVGQCRNARRVVEAIIHIPNFTCSVASNGQVRLENSLIGSLKRPQDLSLLATQPELLGPGDLATNDSGNGAVTLDRNSRVTGNVQSCGTVSVLGGSRVEGEVRSPWSRTDLPSFDISDYDPAETDALNYQELPSGIVGGQDLVGLVRADGNLRVTGNVKLDNALVYVDGNLIVDGGLSGVGAIMVTGDTTVRGGVNLTSDDSIALLSDGNVTLAGDQPNRYEFHGLIYTRGNFLAENFTVVGSFIANGRDSDTGNVTLLSSKAYFTDVKSFVPIFYPRQLVLQIASSNPVDPKALALPDGNVIQWGNFPGSSQPQQYPLPWKTPQDAAAHVNGQPYNGYEEADDGPWHWYDTVIMEVRKENNQLVYYLTYNPHPLPDAVTYPERFTSQQAVIERLVTICATMCPDYNDGESPAGPSVMETSEYRRDVFYPALFAQWNVEQPPPGQPIELNFTMDPNRFLSKEDKIRVATWLEY